MDIKKFTMRDESFICEVCKREVEPLRYTARDHCPFCLSSLHVDNNPGDRSSSCHGVMVPVGMDKVKSDDYKIVYKCTKCHEIKRNIMAKDDSLEELLRRINDESNF